MEFYILYSPSGDCYRLVYRPMNFCWATSNDLSHLLERLKKVILKYRNRKTLERVITGLDSYKRDAWGESQEDLFQKGFASPFEELVEMTKRQALEELAKSRRPVKRTLLVKKKEEAPKEKPRTLVIRRNFLIKRS